jgi:hypothetical protein
MGKWKTMQILYFSNKDASCLQTEAQSAFETYCLSVLKYLLHGKSPSEEYGMSMLSITVKSV